MSDALILEGVRFSYGDVPVLAGIDLAVPTGGITTLMGPSGCGKSTLLAIVAGLLEKDAGRVERNFERAAIMFQDPLLLPWRTALANVGFALKAGRVPAAERRKRAGEMLVSVGLSEADAEKYPRQLSGGMRQRVALARALVTEPDFLILDEPFSSLDGDLARQMHSLVRGIVEERGVTAIIVTHDAAEAARISERIVTLSPAPARVAGAEDVPGPSGGR
ncbi:ABC transporter ATP-binding protein [Rhodobium gokarnense]|uniref:NitT/TauT family transport system ATP-binding protein n=1 Tax=Rhodobium gokarnense TaxID=364296 RepID=A0ABT3HAA8_9HYPH|nr:ATP-binding cassette domain-containing protein [Rhodobium gokarnense]MCW2307331.1 NitT/TauT family transport system ATP-binding protein [Rhodobium gokarnense]